MHRNTFLTRNPSIIPLIVKRNFDSIWTMVGRRITTVAYADAVWLTGIVLRADNPCAIDAFSLHVSSASLFPKQKQRALRRRWHKGMKWSPRVNPG